MAPKTGRPRPSSKSAQRRMRCVRRQGTAAELSLRSLLHSQGLRYRVDRQVIPGLRRRPDIIFKRAKVAVFVDGCFWHLCPWHKSFPKANATWWAEKLAANKARDADTNRRLRSAGWRVVRIWEHTDPIHAAVRLAALVRPSRVKS